MRRFKPFSLGTVNLMADECLESRSCFAGLDALVPRVIKFCVASTSAVSEPRTAASATTRFARSFNSAAFGTHRTGDTRRVRWYYLYGSIGQTSNRHCQHVFTLHVIRFRLTFAGLNAIKPPVINVFVAGTSAGLIPSTARSATTDYARFLEPAAL